MRTFAYVMAAALVVGLTASASAAPKPKHDQKVTVKPWVYDPDHTGNAVSQWIDKIGLPDKEQKQKDVDKGKTKGASKGLWLEKDGPTSGNVAAGAAINFTGTLTELGFDIHNGSHDGAGAPRFNVYTTTGVYYFFGSASGIHSPVPDEPGWTRVTFEPSDGYSSQTGTNDLTSFDDIEVTGIDIVFDEGTDQGTGFALLDNIDINGVLIGGPEGANVPN
jgi:hypothetical protein